MAITQVVSVRTTGPESARPRGRSRPSGRFDSGDFDTSPGDSAHHLGYSLRTRQIACPIARLTVGFRNDLKFVAYAGSPGVRRQHATVRPF